MSNRTIEQIETELQEIRKEARALEKRFCSSYGTPEFTEIGEGLEQVLQRKEDLNMELATAFLRRLDQ